MPRNFRTSVGGSHFIVAENAGDHSEFSLGYEAYSPGTVHVVAEHRTGISQESFNALRQDARNNSRTFKASTPSVQDQVVAQKPRSAKRQMRTLNVERATNPLLEKVV